MGLAPDHCHHHGAPSWLARTQGLCHAWGPQHPIGRIKGHFALFDVSKYLLLASAHPAKCLECTVKVTSTPLQHPACCKHPVNRKHHEHYMKEAAGVLAALQNKCRRQVKCTGLEGRLTMPHGLVQHTGHWSPGTLCCMWGDGAKASTFLSGGVRFVLQLQSTCVGIHYSFLQIISL